MAGIGTPALPTGKTGQQNMAGSVSVTVASDQTAIPVTANLVPLANSGWNFLYFSGLTNSASIIKNSPGTFGGWAMLYNPNTAVTYLQFFNKLLSSVSLGSTAPDFVIPLPGVATASATGLAANLEISLGIKMGTGIIVAATTSPTNSTAPSSPVIVTFLYL